MAKKVIIVLSFIGISFMVLIFGGGYICGYDFRRKTNIYSFTISNCKGINGSVLVYLNGYKVGGVKNVVFDKKNFSSKVYFSVDKDIIITENSSISVDSPFFGDKSLLLNIGEGKPIKPGDSIRVIENNTDLGGLLKNLKNVSEGLSVFLDKLNKENIQKNASGSLKGISVLLKNFNEGRIVDKVSGILENTQKVVTNVNSLIDDVKKNPQKYLKALL
jgi:phospholipid/cholesterol/gamma-HCH transport system substrate-binding protein